MQHTPSPWQQEIKDFMDNGEGNGRVIARAGSAKTTTSVWLAQDTPGSALMVAFNKSIARELQNRLPPSDGFSPSRKEARTLHSAGLGVLKKRIHNPFINKYKAMNVAREYVEAHEKDKRKQWEKSLELRDVLSLCRLRLMNPILPDGTADIEKITQLCLMHGIIIDERTMYAVPRLFMKMIELAEKDGVIDYDDMLFLPIYWDLPYPKYDTVFIDEAQDLSLLQIKNAISYIGGRGLAVGDDKQAIYYFAGGDAEAFEVLGRVLKATDFSLPVCYRCPESHLELIRSFVPDILARDGAPEGEIHSIMERDISQSVQPNDLVMCRTNAPLLGACASTVKERIPAFIRGAGLDAKLIRIASKIGDEGAIRGYGYSSFDILLSDWREMELRRLQKAGATRSQISRTLDYAACLRIANEHCEGYTYEDLYKYIKFLFREQEDAVCFSSVHRAKGLEADRTFILRPEIMPLPIELSEVELEQERNIYYIACTRAKQSLTFVRGEKDNPGSFENMLGEEDDSFLVPAETEQDFQYLEETNEDFLPGERFRDALNTVDEETSIRGAHPRHTDIHPNQR